MSNVVSLQPTGPLPAKIEDLILNRQWTALANCFREGLSPELTAYGGTSLFELILCEVRLGEAPLPEELLNAIMEAGLPRGPLALDDAQTVVSLCAEYGQWQWMETLIQKGFLVDTPHWPIAAAIGLGRQNRYFSQEAIYDLLGVDEEIDLENFPAWQQQHYAQSLEQAYGRLRQLREAEKEPLEKAVAYLRLCGVNFGATVKKEQDEERNVEGAVAGLSPLLMAIAEHDHEWTQLLIEQGADIATPHCSEGSLIRPLDMAVKVGNLFALRQLLLAGAPVCINPLAPPHLQDRSHPLIMACAPSHFHEEVLSAIAGAMSKDQLEEVGSQAMQLSAAGGHVCAMRGLRKIGIPYTVRTSPSGYQPLHQAAKGGHRDAVEFLLRRGQKLSDAASNGVTAASLLLAHPQLAEEFKVSPKQTGNVRAFSPRARV